MTPHKDTYYMMSSPSYREAGCPLMWEYRVGVVNRFDVCGIAVTLYSDRDFCMEFARKI